MAPENMPAVLRFHAAILRANDRPGTAADLDLAADELERQMRAVAHLREHRDQLDEKLRERESTYRERLAAQGALIGRWRAMLVLMLKTATPEQHKTIMEALSQ